LLRRLFGVSMGLNLGDKGADREKSHFSRDFWRPLWAGKRDYLVVM